MDEDEDQCYGDANNSQIENVIDILQYDDSLNFLYDETSKHEVKEVLTQLGFETLIPIFEIEKIDMYAFVNMENDVIYGILKSFPWGIRVRFAKAYKDWKENIFNKKANPQTLTQNIKVQSDQCVNDSSLEHILQEVEEGKEFMQQLSEGYTVLSISEKRKLAAIIVNYYIEKGLVLSKREVEILSKSIEKTFPGESASEYCNAKSGILYNRLKNSTNKYRKKGILEQPSAKKKIKLTDELSQETTETFDERELDGDTFIKSNYLEPLKDIVNYWEVSYKVRRRNMQKLKGLSEIIDEYKSFIRSDGWMLVNSDFAKLMPNTNFNEKWRETKENLFKILKNNVTNAAIKNKVLNESANNENLKTLAIIYGLNAFLYASGVRKDPSGSKGKKVKDTILDSIQTMILICKNQEAMTSDLLAMQNNCKEKGQTMQPLIVAFGRDENNISNDFLIIFDKHFYKFTSLDKTLEILLKLFYVFDLKFPTASHSVFCFLCSFFLGAPVEISYKVQSLINMLNANLL